MNTEPLAEDRFARTRTVESIRQGKKIEAEDQSDSVGIIIDAEDQSLSMKKFDTSCEGVESYEEIAEMKKFDNSCEEIEPNEEIAEMKKFDNSCEEIEPNEESAKKKKFDESCEGIESDEEIEKMKKASNLNPELKAKPPEYMKPKQTGSNWKEHCQNCHLNGQPIGTCIDICRKCVPFCGKNSISQSEVSRRKSGNKIGSEGVKLEKIASGGSVVSAMTGYTSSSSED